MQNEPPIYQHVEPTEKRWDAWRQVCKDNSECDPVSDNPGIETYCLTYYLAQTKDESEFSYGTGCWGLAPDLCPGPDMAAENLNYENTLSYHWEASCTNK